MEMCSGNIYSTNKRIPTIHILGIRNFKHTQLSSAVKQSVIKKQRKKKFLHVNQNVNYNLLLARDMGEKKNYIIHFSTDKNVHLLFAYREYSTVIRKGTYHLKYTFKHGSAFAN